MDPFILQQIYKRTDIHLRYKGQDQGGISTPSQYPYIFIFSGHKGKMHGYEDGWDSPHIFSYTGEGQIGDMKFVRGNLALKDHLKTGKRVFLFEYVRSGYVKYVAELELFDFDYFETPDRDNNKRLGIRFFFKRSGDMLPSTAEVFKGIAEVKEPKDLYSINVPGFTERRGLLTSRVGQGAYRKRIIHRWEYKCAVTGFTKPDVLIASHIVPWAEANDHQRLDVDNGILLSPVYDALFDRHLISFENSGKIILSEKIDFREYEKIGVNGSERISNFSEGNREYLERHRVRLNV